jgi:hypothetical protein
VTGDPFRERLFDAAEVRRALRVAVELAEHDPETKKTERALTRAELERSAEELGLPASAIGRALQGDELPGGRPQDRSRWIGAPTRIVLEAEVPGEPSEADREDLVEDIREVARRRACPGSN